MTDKKDMELADWEKRFDKEFYWHTCGIEDVKQFIAQEIASAVEAEREKIEERIKELRLLHQSLLDKHERNRLIYQQNSDSIKAKEAVISDENSGYICEVWGRLNELESLSQKGNHAE
jgi:hypothetical protein